MKKITLLLSFGVLFVVALLFFGRYEAVPSQQVPVYRLDRWTGEVRMYAPGGWRDIKPFAQVTTSAAKEPEYFTEKELEEFFAKP